MLSTALASTAIKTTYKVELIVTNNTLQKQINVRFWILFFWLFFWEAMIVVFNMTQRLCGGKKSRQRALQKNHTLSETRLTSVAGTFTSLSVLLNIIFPLKEINVRFPFHHFNNKALWYITPLSCVIFHLIQGWKCWTGISSSQKLL